MQHTLFLGEPSPIDHRYREIARRIFEAGQAPIRPAIPCREICRSPDVPYAEHDLLRFRTVGHGHRFGVLCPHWGREIALELREEVETVLERGTAISIEPMIANPEGMSGVRGYREREVPVVTVEGMSISAGFRWRRKITGYAHTGLRG